MKGAKIKEKVAKKVGLVGLQPALLESLVQALDPERVMASDLDLGGAVRCQVKILDGMQPGRCLRAARSSSGIVSKIAVKWL